MLRMSREGLPSALREVSFATKSGEKVSFFNKSQGCMDQASPMLPICVKDLYTYVDACMNATDKY